MFHTERCSRNKILFIIIVIISIIVVVVTVVDITNISLSNSLLTPSQSVLGVIPTRRRLAV